MRVIVRVSMALVALAAAALSYQSLARLGFLCGYAGLSWLYPLVVDLGAAASCATWLHARSRQALAMTWGLLASSVVLNGTVHYLDSTHTAPSWLLVVGVAAVPPTVLGLCVHLSVGLGQADAGGCSGTTPSLPADRREETPEDPVADLCPPEGAEAPDFWATAPFADTPGGRAAELLEQGAGRRKLSRELGISEYKARQLKAERNGVAS